MIGILAQIGAFIIDLSKIDSKFNRFKHIGLFLTSFAASAEGAYTGNKYMMWAGFVLALGTHMRKAFGKRKPRLFHDAPPLGVPIHTSEVTTKPHARPK